MKNGYLPNVALPHGLFNDPTIDPFTLKPLCLKQTGNSLIIYSVGEDQIDNGGDVRSDRRPKAPRDIGFILLAPQQRRLPPATQPAMQTAPSEP